MKDEEGQKPGTRAVATKGSLVGLLIARHGTSELALTEEEIFELKGWFEQGGGREIAGKE